MWDSIIYTEFNYLRVDHDQFDILRICLIENTHNDRIDTYRLSGSGRSRDQKMWHLCNICYDHLACNIFSCGECNIGRMFFKFFRFDQLTKCYGYILFVRHFDTNRRFSGDRCLDTDIGCCEVQFDIICKVHDLADLHTHFRL